MQRLAQHERGIRGNEREYGLEHRIGDPPADPEDPSREHASHRRAPGCQAQAVYTDLVEGVSMREVIDDSTGISNRVVVDWKGQPRGGDLRPRIVIHDAEGNPMMLALAENKIDAIFDTQGQKCHDVAAGFIIALRAGAFLKSLDSEETLTEAEIVQDLRTPEKKFRYVVASNEPLANELVQLLNSKNGAVIEFKDPAGHD